MVNLLKTPQLPFNNQHYDNLQLNGQNTGNSSFSDLFDEDNSQDSFDSFSPIGSDTLGSSPWLSGAEMGAPSFLGWGWSVAPPAGLAFPSSVSAASAGSSSSGPSATASGASGSGGSSQVVSTSGSGLVFDNTYESSCTAAFIACIVSAEDELESLFTNSVTINLDLQEANQGKNGAALGNNWAGWTPVSYSTLRSTLLKFAPSDVLPTSSPAPSGTDFNLPEAYARMLGLNSSTPTIDDTVTLNTYYPKAFGQDVINGLIHEISEGGLGRVGGLGDQNGVWSTMDLFRYTAAGAPDYTDGRDGVTTYFSSDGGATVSNQNESAKGAPTLSFNNEYNSSGTRVNKGDTADWTQNAVFGSTGNGETLTLNQTELDLMEALGWNLSLKQDVYEEALGGWETPTSWSTGSMPIEPQDAYIGSASGAIVTLNSNVTVHSIATSTGAEFAIGNSTASTLIAYDGTVLNSEDTSSVASGNLGKLGVDPGSALQIGNTFDNVGTLAIGKGAGGSGEGAYLYLDDTLGAVTLDGGGTVDLGQLANASDDEIQTYGDILNAPGTSGDGLINVNNTISGAGVIELGSFDNQASGIVEASQAGGFYLQIIAPTFTNEGTLAAQSGAVLELGQNGGTGSLTNTGAIDLASKGDLAISGDYTISGSGAIDFKGAGAEITSDGTAAATFNNDSAINAVFSGQIGDVGVFASNDLTFDNDGTVTASGSGVTLTINTGGHTVVNQANGVLESEDDAILAILSNLNNQGGLEAGSSTSSGTTTGTLDLGTDGGTGSMTNTGEIAILGGSDLAISGDYTITTPSSSSSGAIDFKGAGAEITSDGKGPATFTNATTINAVYSGQIGDVGILASNDLTFDNDGAVYASGSGVTLTINTGSHTVVNESSGVLEAEDDAILAIVSNVSNQNTIAAGSSNTTGTLDLGADGGTGSMTNTAAVAIYGDSDLAISGNYTVTGSGDIYFKGAGAEITSDGNAATTFTNKSTIEAVVSGQIGDQGIKSANDLTFVNAGDVGASGSGVTLTLNTGSLTINDGGGLLEAEDDAILAIDSNVNTGQPSSGSPPGGTIEATSGGTVTLSAAVADGVSGSSVPGQVVIHGGTFEMLAGASVSVPIEFTAAGTLEILDIATISVSGSNGAITAISGDNISLTSGTGDTITGAGFTITATSGTKFTVGGNGLSGANDVVNGSSLTVALQANSHLTVNGSTDTITMGATSDLTVAGSTDAISATFGDKISLTSGTGDTIKAAGVTVTAASGTQFTIGGNGVSGANDVVNGSHATVALEANSRLTVNGSNDTITMGATSSLTVAGSTDAITATTGDKISLASGTGDTITGAGFTVTAASGTKFTVGGNGVSGADDVVNGAANASVGIDASSNVTLNGSSDTITMGATSDLTVAGSTDAISATFGDKISLTSGTGDTIKAAGVTVTGASGTKFTIGGNGVSGANDVVDGSGLTVAVQSNSRMTLNGSSDTVTMGATSDLVVDGSTDAISATTDDVITVSSGTGEVISGSGFTVHGGSGAGFTIKGTGDIVYAGLNDALTDGGASDTFKIGSNVGSLKISDFGSDTTGIVDLLNGVGGYTTAAAAFHALASDGAGGSLLSLGTDGSIDLLGVAPTSLQVTNFKIG